MKNNEIIESVVNGLDHDVYSKAEVAALLNNLKEVITDDHDVVLSDLKDAIESIVGDHLDNRSDAFQIGLNGFEIEVEVSESTVKAITREIMDEIKDNFDL